MILRVNSNYVHAVSRDTICRTLVSPRAPAKAGTAEL